MVMFWVPEGVIKTKELRNYVNTRFEIVVRRVMVESDDVICQSVSSLAPS